MVPGDLNLIRSVRTTSLSECRQLTISLLKQDFGLDVKLPEDRLCPPVRIVCMKSRAIKPTKNICRSQTGIGDLIPSDEHGLNVPG